jgi:hypothetical protein
MPICFPLSGPDAGDIPRAAVNVECSAGPPLTRRSNRVPRGGLGVLPGLVFVEQRHYLADHVADGIVAELLGNRHQPDTVLGKAPDTAASSMTLTGAKS